MHKRSSHKAVRAHLQDCGLRPCCVRAFEGAHRVRVRYAFFRCASHFRRARITLFPGFNESFLFYAGVIRELLGHGFDVAAMDHRGQGLSAREEAVRHTPHVAHVRAFDDYVTDAVHFIDAVLPQEEEGAHALMGHSMGGYVALCAAARCTTRVRCVLALSPMLEVRAPLHLSRDAMGRVAAFACRYGCGKRLMMCRATPSTATETIDERNTDWNDVTHSRAALRMIGRVRRKFPEVAVAGPSYRWISEATRALRELWSEGARVPRALRERGAAVLVLTAGRDAYVDSRAAKEFASTRLGGVAAHRQIDGAYHNLLLEQAGAQVRALECAMDFMHNVVRGCTGAAPAAFGDECDGRRHSREVPPAPCTLPYLACAAVLVLAALMCCDTFRDLL